MKYSELRGKYTTITSEIGHIKENMIKDNDLALKRKIDQLRKEQKEIGRMIDEYNGGKSE